MAKRFMYSKVVVMSLLCMLLLTIAVHGHAQSKDKLKVYVWNFSTRDSTKDDLAENLTQEFEEALLQEGCFTVLERRRYDQLLAQRDNEKAIMDMEGISQTSINNFRAEGANTFIFGEVHDDTDRQEIKVLVTVQAFDGKKIAIESIRFKPDTEPREAKMQELAKELCANFKGMRTSTKIVLGVSSAAALGGVIALITATDKDGDNNGDNLFSGTYMVDEPIIKADDGRNEKHTYILNLSQDGASITGIYERIREIYDCCTLSYKLDVTGTVQENTGHLSWGPGRDSCQCHDNESDSRWISEEGGTFPVTAINDGKTLRVEKNNDYWYFIRQ